MRTIRALLIVPAIMLWLSTPAVSQVIKGGDSEKLNLDLAVPESPAFTVLGLTPQTVARPATFQEFSSALLNGVDRNGNFQTGLALDTIPYLLAAGYDVTLKKYTEHYPTRLLSRTQLSLATAKGSSDDDKALRVATGVRVTPWDLGDPRYDQKFTGCLGGLPALPSIPPTDPKRTEKLAQTEEESKKVVRACREEAQTRLWNESSFAIGFAPSFISRTGNADDIRGDGVGVWASFAYGFEGIPLLENTAQFILHTRYRTKENVPDTQAKGQFFVQDSVLVGGRLRVGGQKIAFSVEGSFIHAEPNGRRPQDDSIRMSVGGDLRLTQDLWLELSIGGEGGRRDGNNQAFVLGALKWGVSTQRSQAVK